MKIKIRYVTLVEIMLLISSVGGLIISISKIGNAIYYCSDVINIILCIFAIRKIVKNKQKYNFRILNLIFIIFIFNTVAGAIINNVSIKLVLWGTRNVYRFYLFFVSCCILLEKEDIEETFKLYKYLFIINFIITIFQFFIFKLKGDYLGGIFGNKQGCNGATTIFINIYIAYIICGYLNKNFKLRTAIPYFIMYFVISGLAELKGNFIFFAIIYLIAIMLFKKNRRTISLSCLALIMIVVGLNVLQKAFPGSYEIVFNMSKANSYMDARYFEYKTFTRNKQLETVNKYFFDNNIILYLFGYGIGACDTSQYITSDFFEQYGYMNYRQYGASMMTLQNGYSGLILYFTFFVYCGIYAVKNGKQNSSKLLNAFVPLVSVFAIVDSFYASLFIDSAYWIYFVFAIPFILNKNIDDKEKKRNDS